MSLSDQLWCPTTAQVTVLQARGLRIKGKNGANDAYAVMQLGKEKYQTSVAEKSVAPVWKEEASFDMPSAQQGGTERGTLHVHVLHRALVGPDKLLGQAVIDLLQLSEDQSRDKTQWFKLLDKSGKPDKDRGEVLVDIQFTRNNLTASMFDISTAGKSRSRLGKFKDKVRGKKKEDALSETSSNVVPAFSQVMTDSEDERGSDVDGAAAGREPKKKNKVKSLFSHKTNLQKSLSQSMSVLPGKNSSLSGSVSSGLNVEASEGKKKFKFLSHKRTGSSGKKDQKLVAEQSNLCINGSHVYCEEAAPRTSRASSNFSLASSGVGSMEDVPDSSPPSVGSRRSVRHSSPWTEEEEEDTIEASTQEGDEEMFRRQELEKLAEEESRMEEEQRREEERRLSKEEERIRRDEEKRQNEEEERKRREDQDRMEEELRMEKEREKQMIEEARKLDEERKRVEEKIRFEREKERQREENERLEEEKRMHQLQEEQERRRLEKEKADQERKRKEVEEEEQEHRVRKEQEYERLKAEQRKLEEETRRRDEEKQEEEARRRREEEERRQEEEARQRREEEELEEERRREEERQSSKKKLEEWRQEEEARQRREEEKLEKRRQEEEARRRREEEELEEERRQEEEARQRQEEEELEEERTQEEEARQRREEEERQEEEARRRREEEKLEMERLAEEKRCKEEEKLEKAKLAEEERRQKEEEIRREEEKLEMARLAEERLRREEEKLEKARLAEEEQRREEKKGKEEEKLQIENLAVEKRREKEERRRREEEVVARQKKEEKLEEERLAVEERQKREEMARLEEEEQRLVEGKRRREEDDGMGDAQRHCKTASDAHDCTDVTSTNPFEESGEDEPLEDFPERTVTVTSARQRCKLPVEKNTCSFSEKDPSTTQDDKRQAPKPPRMNSSERQRAAQHETQVNKLSKDIRTASILPQRAEKKINPVNTASSHTNDPHKTASSGRKPAPQRPDLTEEILLPKGSQGPILKSKQAPAVPSLNPFDGDEEVDSDSKTTTAASRLEQSFEKDAVSQIKTKSSKRAHAPTPPAKNSPALGTDTGHEGTLCDIDEEKDRAPAQETLHKEAVQEAVKKDAPPVPSRRLQPVRPLNSPDQLPVSAVQEQKDGKSSREIINSQRKENVKDTGPYALLTQEELISLVLKQESQLLEKSKKISELEQYIDQLLVRVIEEAPNILMTMTPLK